MFVGGGGMSGNRNANGQCVLDTNNQLRSIDSRFGWGETFQSFNFQNLLCILGTCWRYTELVVGALSDTHSWGSCNVPPNTFKACFEPSYIIGFTLY